MLKVHRRITNNLLHGISNLDSVRMWSSHISAAINNIHMYRFQKSAELNCSWGQANLARAFRDGKGTTVDQLKALEWFQKVKGIPSLLILSVVLLLNEIMLL
jgi:hypothetical protein